MHSSPNASRSTNHLTRRRLLQAGALGLLGLDLPQFLKASATGPTDSSRRAKEKSCIFIVMGGGPSQLDLWDPKPTAPDGIRGPYQPIATAVPGIQVTELLPRVARLADRYALIRSMTHQGFDHGAAMHNFLSGQSRPPVDAPYIGTVTAKLRPATRNIPSYVWLQDLEGDSGVGARYTTGGSLGPAYAPLRIGQGLDNPATPNFEVKAFAAPANVTPERISGRQQLLVNLDAVQQAREPSAPGMTMQHLQQRAFDLLTGPQVRQAFAIQQEPSRIRDRYGWNPLGQNLLMARRLIEAGVRLASVTAFCGKSPNAKYGSQGFVVNCWDMHGNGTPIFGNEWNGLGWCAPRFDQALSALLEDLEQRGLLENTLVIAGGEMGRTPQINKNGTGRDHWPPCFTTLLAGGGIRGGTVHGASDKHAAYVKDNPVTPEDFAATVYQALGISPETRLGADGFTRPASTGQPLLSLLG
ncbi:hypothetical protein AYO44_18645 [Planctomycetaceae bacterium SCGC AG-212-F19]|nr:hypothetical protein AYO44_18645 [Planctomycetaceae bacterium SCGC AG-212-F19]